ncbi:MAG TPA: GAF domain-containing protein [Terriglobales bacterium]|nr:GAF domain-containing protein [Terriglobales bacterium]
MDHYSIIGPADKDREALPGKSSAPTGDAVAPPTPEIPVTYPASFQPAPTGAEQAGGQTPDPVSSTHTEAEHSAAELDAALQALVHKAQYTSNATGAALALRQGADMVCRAASGNSAPDRGARLQIKTGLTAECLRSGELLRCDNVMSDSRVDMESCRRLGIESIIIAPVRQGQKIVGVLELFSAHAYCFQERDVESVKALSQEIGKRLEQGVEAPAAMATAEPPAPAPAPEPPVLDLPHPEQHVCGSCGAKVDPNAVFCAACGSFQESKPVTDLAPRELGWKARLRSRRLLVPAVFVAMALAVAVAPIPRKTAAVSPSGPAVQAAASTAPTVAVPPAHSNSSASAAVAPGVPSGTSAPGAAPASNPTISKSVKQLLGGVSSDFSKLLPVNEKAEPPSNGDPNLKVWVDTRKGYYYCPGDEQYGHTEKGSFMTQKEAESNYYIPALIKPCM